MPKSFAVSSESRLTSVELSARGRAWTAPKAHTILAPDGVSWYGGQVQEPCVRIDPRNPDRLEMFFAAMPPGLARTWIGKMTAPRSNPWAWSGPGDPITAFDGRMDSIVHRDGVDYLFSSPAVTAPDWNTIGIHLLTSQDGINLTDQGVVMTASSGGRVDTNAGTVMQCTVLDTFAIDGKYHMYYGWRMQSGAIIIPDIRHAYSTDLINWVKDPSGQMILAVPETAWIEFKSVMSYGGKIFIAHEDNVSGGDVYNNYVCYADGPEGPFTKSPYPLTVGTGVLGDIDNSQTATSQMIVIDGHTFVFYDAAPNPGSFWGQPWTMVMREMVGTPLDFVV